MLQRLVFYAESVGSENARTGTRSKARWGLFQVMSGSWGKRKIKSREILADRSRWLADTEWRPPIYFYSLFVPIYSVLFTLNSLILLPNLPNLTSILIFSTFLFFYFVNSSTL